jgi:hypothetical protein
MSFKDGGPKAWFVVARLNLLQVSAAHLSNSGKVNWDCRLYDRNLPCDHFDPTPNLEPMLLVVHLHKDELFRLHTFDVDQTGIIRLTLCRWPKTAQYRANLARRWWQLMQTIVISSLKPSKSTRLAIVPAQLPARIRRHLHLAFQFPPIFRRHAVE